MQMTVDRKKVIQILLLTGMCLGSIFLTFMPFTVAEVTALDMLIDVAGYTLEEDLYTYAEYVAMMEELGITPQRLYSRGDTCEHHPRKLPEG